MRNVTAAAAAIVASYFEFHTFFRSFRAENQIFTIAILLIRSVRCVSTSISIRHVNTLCMLVAYKWFRITPIYHHKDGFVFAHLSNCFPKKERTKKLIDFWCFIFTFISCSYFILCLFITQIKHYQSKAAERTATFCFDFSWEVDWFQFVSYSIRKKEWERTTNPGIGNTNHDPSIVNFHEWKKYEYSLNQYGN